MTSTLLKSDGQFQVLILFDLAAVDNVISFALVNASLLGVQVITHAWITLYLMGYCFSVPFSVSSSAQLLKIGDQRSYLEILISVYTHSLGDHLQASWLYHQLLASNFQICIFSSYWVPEFQTYWFNCLDGICTWMFNRYLKENQAIKEFLVSYSLTKFQLLFQTFASQCFRPKPVVFVPDFSLSYNSFMIWHQILLFQPQNTSTFYLPTTSSILRTMIISHLGYWNILLLVLPAFTLISLYFE